MSCLLRAGDEYLPLVNGFINNGSSCWFNAVLNSFLSCPIFNKIMLDNQNDMDYKENLIAVEYVNLLKQLLSNDIKLNSEHYLDLKSTNLTILNHNIIPKNKILSNAKIWDFVLQSTSKRDDTIKFDHGQNCAGEGIDMFLDTMEDLPLTIQLFQLRTKWSSWCSKCKTLSKDKEEIDYTYKIPCSLMNEQSEIFKDIDPNYKKSMPLKDFITMNTGYIDKDYKCNKCSQKGEKFKITKIDFLPEILIVMAKRYKFDGRVCKKINDHVNFPDQMIFEEDETIHYKAVAQIEHIGTSQSGHYWVVCKRSDGWYRIDDQSIIRAAFKPSRNTYIVFYHIV